MKTFKNLGKAFKYARKKGGKVVVLVKKTIWRLNPNGKGLSLA